jgi:hypothetical protein
MKASYMRDHDGDNRIGLTGTPFVGLVPGTNARFQNPRLDIDVAGTGKPIPRTDGLHMAIRNRARLDLRLVSCNPPRFEGIVIPGTLLIETRNVGCTIADTNGEPCTDAYIGFIDGNLPQFVHNGTSQVVSVKAPPDMTCARARTLTDKR